MFETKTGCGLTPILFYYQQTCQKYGNINNVGYLCGALLETLIRIGVLRLKPRHAVAFGLYISEL